ncbi:hypothetical protein [Burkholderia ambifaria]|uniref:hypothetical protein n=1 Tax=Burkholderia ambifaria TaxID=152480 RepID=UPI00158D3A71|nr:hypothetical protein [Burkholderia ambifaria]
MMATFSIDGHTYVAKACVDGILVDPQLPTNIGQMSGGEICRVHREWWNRPFVITVEPMAEACESLALGETRDRWLDDGGQHWMVLARVNVWYEARCAYAVDHVGVSCLGTFRFISNAMSYLQQYLVPECVEVLGDREVGI